MKRCLLFPEVMEWSGLAPLCVGRRGVVFLGLRDEEVPHFIVDAAVELKGKGIVDEAAPCALFARSFLAGSGESGGRDLVLLLKRTCRDVLRRLERWVGEQDNRTVIFLKDYLTTASLEQERRS